MVAKKLLAVGLQCAIVLAAGFNIFLFAGPEPIAASAVLGDCTATTPGFYCGCYPGPEGEPDWCASNPWQPDEPCSSHEECGGIN